MTQGGSWALNLGIMVCSPLAPDQPDPFFVKKKKKEISVLQPFHYILTQESRAELSPASIKMLPHRVATRGF